MPHTVFTLGASHLACGRTEEHTGKPRSASVNFCAQAAVLVPPTFTPCSSNGHLLHLHTCTCRKSTIVSTHLCSQSHMEPQESLQETPVDCQVSPDAFKLPSRCLRDVSQLFPDSSQMHRRCPMLTLPRLLLHDPFSKTPHA